MPMSDQDFGKKEVEREELYHFQENPPNASGSGSGTARGMRRRQNESAERSCGQSSRMVHSPLAQRTGLSVPLAYGSRRKLCDARIDMLWLAYTKCNA